MNDSTANQASRRRDYLACITTDELRAEVARREAEATRERDAQVQRDRDGAAKAPASLFPQKFRH